MNNKQNEQNTKKQPQETIEVDVETVDKPKKVKVKIKKPNQKDKEDILLWTAMSIALLFWTISFLRVPYIGTFLDSVFFEFTVGFAKYPLYALLMVYILCIKIPQLKDIFCKDKRPLWFFAPIFILVIILNTIDSYKKGYNVTIARELYLGENGYITNWLSHYWENTVVKFNVDYITNLTPQSYAFGGIIGLIIVFTTTYFSSAILIIVLVSLFVIYGLIFFCKKYKNKKPKEMVQDLFKKETINHKKEKTKSEESKI